MTDTKRYKIVRFRFEGQPRVIRRGLTLAEAQAWCQSPATSSHSTGPKAWFDGYDEDRGRISPTKEQHPCLP